MNTHGGGCLLCSEVFVQEVVREIARDEPQGVSGDRVRIAIRRAFERGARSEAAIRRFVTLMFALEPEFDQRYRVRQRLSARSESFDDALLRLHEWSHPNCWYRAERSFVEARWNALAGSDEDHPVVEASGVSFEAARPPQLALNYGFQLDVPQVDTPTDGVREMLQIAEVGPDDTVADLGCGNGNVVITAATMFGARGIGIDLDPDAIARARDRAERAGVSHRVTFRRADFFDTDLAGVTVVTLYLLHDLNLALRDKLRNELPRGARIVSWQFDMGDWEPDVRTGRIRRWRV